MKSLTELMSGDTLAQTLARVENDIKSRPADADLRAAFVQLLCLAGHWPRAKTQLKSWLALKPQAQPTVTLLEQTITGEIQRAAVFDGLAMPRMPGEAFAWAEDLLKALRKEHADDAVELRAAAFAAAQPSPARVTTQDAAQAVEWLIDGDGRLGPVCELIVNGHYTWLPFAAIHEIRFQAPASVTDLVWRHAAVTLTDGSEQVCQLPVRYPFTDMAADNLRMATVTEWTPLDDQQFIGHGQKTWLSAELSFPLLSLTHLVFAGALADHE